MPSIPDIFQSIFRFIGGFFKLRNYNLRNFTAYVLVIMIIQYIPLETRAGVSPIKVATMALMPIFLLANFRINRAVVFGSIYWLWIFYTAYVLHPLTFRASTVMYCAMFVITFMTLYTLVYDRHVFTIDWFIRFLKGFIWVFAGFCIVQQFMLMLGIWYFPPFNMCQWLFMEGSYYRVNSISYEPSSFVRSVGVLYYAYLKCCEYRSGKKISIIEAFTGDHRWVTISVLWCLLTTGSGTGVVVLILISIYFLRGYWLFLTLPMFIGCFLIIRNAEIEAFQRVQATAEAALTLDVSQVKAADTSAAVRVAPMVNTFGNLSRNITNETFWVGHGCDYGLQFRYQPELRNMGQIDEYGFISLLLSYFIIYGCLLRFKSIANLMLLFGVGGGIGNIAYGWGLLFIFMVTRYFYLHKDDDYQDNIYEDPEELAKNDQNGDYINSDNISNN